MNKKQFIGVEQTDHETAVPFAAAFFAKVPKIVPHTEAFHTKRNIAPSPKMKAEMKHKIKTEKLFENNS